MNIIGKATNGLNTSAGSGIYIESNSSLVATQGAISLDGSSEASNGINIYNTFNTTVGQNSSLVFTGKTKTGDGIGFTNATLNANVANGSTFTMSGNSTGLGNATEFVNSTVNLNSNITNTGSLSISGVADGGIALRLSGTNSYNAYAGNLLGFTHKLIPL